MSRQSALQCLNYKVIWLPGFEPGSRSKYLTEWPKVSAHRHGYPEFDPLRRELRRDGLIPRGPPPATGLTLSYRFLYHTIMKTTLDIDDELLVKAKALAARERSSVTALIEEGLRLRLRRRASTSHGGKPPSLAIYRGKGGLAQGVNSLSNRSLLDAADSDT